MTKIEYVDATWNPITGCTPISTGCANCYAARMAKRLAGRFGYQEDEPFKVTLHPDRLVKPARWKKSRMIFVCSMGDIFHDDVPFGAIHEIWDVMKACPQHKFLILTKRPERMMEAIKLIYAKERMGWSMGFWEHVWIGVTAENQEQADKRIPILLQIPAEVRFVSVEPMLGPVSLLKWVERNRESDRTSDIVIPGLHWVIAGGESGPGARPMHPAWARSLRDQCVASGIPYFFKQWGEWVSVSEVEGEGQHFYFDDGATVRRVGKKKAGRLLDGRSWNQYPT